MYYLHRCFARWQNATTRKHPFQLKKSLGGGDKKNESEGFSGGASGRYTPAGVGAELTHFAGNGFERRRIAVPQGNFFGFGRPHGRLFLWLRAAQTKGFSEGEKFLGQP